MRRLDQRLVVALTLVGGVLPLLGTTVFKAQAGLFWIGGCTLLVIALIVLARVRAADPPQ